jgi:S-DNA-T family DNA segregation ATPase FtsK/SpoIIIE
LAKRGLEKRFGSFGSALHAPFTSWAKSPARLLENERYSRSNAMTDFSALPPGQSQQDPSPPENGRYIARFAASVGAGLVGLYGLGATLTYRMSDPSLNAASDEPVKNLFGAPGAAFADVLLQTIGAAAPFLMAALVVAGGLRVVQGRLFEAIPRKRLVVGGIGVLLLAMSASSAPAPGNWPLAAGFGGVLGDGLLHIWASILALPGIPGARLLAGLCAGMGAVAAFSYAFSVTGRDMHGAAARAAGAAADAGRRAQRAIAHMGDRMRPAEDEPEPWDTYRARGIADGRASHRAAPVVDAAWEPQPTAREPEPAAFDEPIRSAPRPREEQRAAPAPAPSASSAPRAAPRRPAAAGNRSGAERRPGQNFVLPTPDLLTPAVARSNQAEHATLQPRSRQLEEVLSTYGVQGEVLAARPGPVVTLFELEPAPGVRSNRVIGIADDIARSMSAKSARVAIIPGRNAVGIELPNQKRETVYLSALLASASFRKGSSALPLALGETIEGEPFCADLTKMPHLLIAGTTGSGKSVGINAMILSLLYRHTPEECRFIMIDPKMLELSVYEGIPHLLSPVVTEPKKAVVALKWVVREMEERYRKMSKMGVRSITVFNDRVREAIANGEEMERVVHAGFDPETGDPVHETRSVPLETMPYIVVVIDEMADLMLVAGKEIETAVQRLAAMARAAGIHLIMATQRPSVDVITGTIKANFPTRISYKVTSKVDSRTILDQHGAEQLVGMGDLLLMDGGVIRRMHGPYVTEGDVERVVAMLRAQGAPAYRSDVTEDPDEAGGEEAPDLFEPASTGDDLYDRAVEIVVRDKKASTSYLQRRLQVGYNRAASLIERLEKDGVISGPNHAGKREVLTLASE